MTVPIKVLFLLQRPEAWVNFSSVWAAMRSAPNFAPELLVLPYNFEDQTISLLKAPIIRTLLRSLDIPFEEWSPSWSLANGKYDAVVINHPYDRERPRDLWFDRLSAAVPLTIYVPYGLPMGGGRKNLRLQFAQATQAGASVIVARSNWEKQMYALHCPVGDVHVRVLGHPRFDKLLCDMNLPIPAEMADAIGGRVAVLWNSHFSFAHSYSQSSNFSTFDLVGPELFEYAKANRDWLCLIWRPHPGLFPVVLREAFLSSEEIAALKPELAEAGVLLDESPSYVAAFVASDAILTDVGSFLLEYLATGKPIQALLNPEGERLNEESAALVMHYSKASTGSEVIDFIQELRTGGNNLPDLALARAEHLPGLDGHAGERVTRLIKRLTAGVANDEAAGVAGIAPISVTNRDHSHLQQNGARTPDLRADEPPTPTLDKLIRELRRLRNEKAHEPSWRKKLRRVINSSRISLGESIKQSPGLMRFADTLRKQARFHTE